MRKTILIAAALLASPATAQVYGDGCRGETMSDLARCIESQMPPPLESRDAAVSATPAAPANSKTVQPTRLGGALEPSNLRREPPVVRPSVTSSAPGLSTESGAFDPLAGLRDNPAATAIELDPLAGTGVGYFDLQTR